MVFAPQLQPIADELRNVVYPDSQWLTPHLKEALQKSDNQAARQLRIYFYPKRLQVIIIYDIQLSEPTAVDQAVTHKDQASGLIKSFWDKKGLIYTLR